MPDDARAKMSSNADPRAVRVRSDLVNTYRRLVNDGTPPKNIRDVTTAAGVRRPTFYAHFANIDDLAVKVLVLSLADMADRDLWLRETLPVAEAARVSLTEFVDYITREHQIFLHAITTSGGATSELVVSRLSVSFAGLFDHLGVDPEFAGVASRFAAAGVWGAVANWLVSGRTMPVDRLVTHLNALLPVRILTSEEDDLTE